MKVCSRCKTEKELTEFNKCKSKKDGYSYTCRVCNKLYLKEHYQNNKQYYSNKRYKNRNKAKEFNRSILSQLGCFVCDEDHIACLDWHHEDPDDKIEHISVMARNQVRRSNIINEMYKCIVLCSNCHRKLHYNERT